MDIKSVRPPPTRKLHCKECGVVVPDGTTESPCHPGSPIFWSSGPHFMDTPQDEDRAFLLSLDRQLADAVTFLPPAMRASFHAQVGALIKLAQNICDMCSGVELIGDQLEGWRVQRDRIRERTGG